MTTPVHQDLQLAPTGVASITRVQATLNPEMATSGNHPTAIETTMAEVIGHNKEVLRRTLHLFPPYLRPYLLKLG